MRIPRIYQAGDYQKDDHLLLSEDAYQHIIKVLRLTEQSPLILFNGKGLRADANIHSIQKKNCQAYIKKVTKSSPPIFERILIQSIIKPDKMDWLLQKATELGVTKIIPVLSEHCQIKQQPDFLKKRFCHWQKIIINACEQCERDYLPDFFKIQSFSDCLKMPVLDKSFLKIILDPYAQENLAIASFSEDKSGIVFAIGPEGGWTETEIQQAKTAGYTTKRFGENILRSETAAMAMLAISQIIALKPFPVNTLD